MKPLLVLYATREGHTHTIAEQIGMALRWQGHVVDVMDVSKLHPTFVLPGHAGAILAASVHAGKHEREMVHFVREHKKELDRMPTAFLSVSLSEANAENVNATPGKRAEAAKTVEEQVQTFFRATDWHPGRVKPVAGALLYTKMGRFKRFVMRMIASSQGTSTDTTKDHVYTDWVALSRFVAEFSAQLKTHA